MGTQNYVAGRYLSTPKSEIITKKISANSSLPFPHLDSRSTLSPSFILLPLTTSRISHFILFYFFLSFLASQLGVAIIREKEKER